MRWMDGHCDVLYKMWSDSEATFYNPLKRLDLDVTYEDLCTSHIHLQTFAIFVPTRVPRGQRGYTALRQIDLFYEKVIQDEEHLVLVTSGEDVSLCAKEAKGALLALEGAEALEGELEFLRLFHRLGVRQMGLTWNQANEVADGIQEERGGGLTHFGRCVVKEMERLKMVLDVSHLSVKGFWEVLEEGDADLAILASHSNAFAICPHSRNLHDDQIKALIQRKGLIGITFVPQFVHRVETEALIEHVLFHIDHICSLGGEDAIYFGSDFDGITTKVQGLENASKLNDFQEVLLKRYSDAQVEKWTWQNGYDFYTRCLPTKRKQIML